MLNVLQVAGPVLLLVIVLTILMILWMVSRLNREQRLLMERLDSVERDLGQVNESLVVLSGHAGEQAKS